MSGRLGREGSSPSAAALVLAFAVTVALCACEAPSGSGPADAPARGARPPALRFADATAGSGIDFTTTSGGTPSREILEVDGSGVALFDFDDDGDLDVFLPNGATLDAPVTGPGSRLYANRGDGTFEDVTRAAGIELTRWAMGVAVGDVDGDGRDDLYVTCFGPNVLLRNETTTGGGPRFVDVTEEAGVGDDRWSTSAAFGDLDGDGDLDLFVVNYIDFDPQRPPARARFQGVEVMAGPAGLPAQGDVLYVNETAPGGPPGFRDATAEAGIVERTPGYGLGLRIFDFDGDGRRDVFVGNDSTENYLWRNLGGLRFENVGMRSGVAANFDGATQATMGIALGDVDGNGAPDLFTTNFSHDTNTLHLNLGDGFFDDRTAQFGLGLISRPYLGWGAGFFDFDLDGDEDLLFVNGHVYPEAGPVMGTEYAQPPLLFERRPERFEPHQPGPAALDAARSGRSIAFGDLDRDGDVDAVLTTLNGPVRVLRNDAPPQPALVVALEQADANRRAYGARVELQAGGRVQRRWIDGGGSYQSVDAPEAAFGLGFVDRTGDAADGAGEDGELRVVWPDGARTRHPLPPLDGRRVVVRRADGSVPGEPPVTEP